VFCHINHRDREGDPAFNVLDFPAHSLVLGVGCTHSEMRSNVTFFPTQKWEYVFEEFISKPLTWLLKLCCLCLQAS